MPPCMEMLHASSITRVSLTAILGSSILMGRSTLSSLPCVRSTEERNSLTTISSPLRMPATSCPATVAPRNAGSS
uniref:Alternative protein MLL n=1 Tax=Homo sapiens TaxID=9606 RepID=L0R899_HUMAN|nr:alternative protein MLL [Homo sapiens]